MRYDFDPITGEIDTTIPAPPPPPLPLLPPVEKAMLIALFQWEERIVTLSALNHFMAWLRLTIPRTDDRLIKDILQADLATATRLQEKLTTAFHNAPIEPESEVEDGG
jgi:hypothetical protein